MNNVLVISHGRNHRIIDKVNYKTSKFLDPDTESNPDYIISASNKFITRTIKQKFDYIILAASPAGLILSSIIVEDNINPIDGKLNYQLFTNIRLLLNDKGVLYSASYFYYDDIINNQIYIDKLFNFGFIFERLFIFNIYKNRSYIKLIKTELPTKSNCFDYLIEVIKIRSLLQKVEHIQFIYLKYYSYIYDTEITQKTIVDEIFDNEDLLPYKNLDYDDPDYISENEKHTPYDYKQIISHNYCFKCLYFPLSVRWQAIHSLNMPLELKQKIFKRFMSVIT